MTKNNFLNLLFLSAHLRGADKKSKLFLSALVRAADKKTSKSQIITIGTTL